MADKKMIKTTVEELVEEIKKNPSKRFSKSDYQGLVYAVLSDPDFKAKKYLVRNSTLIIEETSHYKSMLKFLDKLLKHAGMSDPEERSKVLDTFEYSSKDLEWVAEAVDEAMFIYSECDKNMRVFRDKMLQLTVKKIIRTGKSAGLTSYRKSVLDRTKLLKAVEKAD